MCDTFYKCLDKNGGSMGKVVRIRNSVLALYQLQARVVMGFTKK